MIAAIYSRKSKFTGKGDSIENQIQMCKEYGIKNLNIDKFLIYEDEGFSGGNTNRPKFKELLSDIKEKKFNVLICYRLDRISRNVADFSSTLQLLQCSDISFVSIKEQFDTSTPMGKAMVYIASVFAQLERETIAERVRDNMLQLAKTGRWLGGQTPLGFKSEKIVYIDEEYKERSLYKLSPIKEELEIVKYIYSTYLETHSLRKTASRLYEKKFKTKNGGDWGVSQVQNILSSPTYVKSSKKIKDFLISQGMSFAGKVNGNGIFIYNKKKGKTKHRDINEWIAAVGKHKGIIESDIWLEVQCFLNSKRFKRGRLGTGSNSLFSGLIKCGKCGCNMTIIHGGVSKGTRKHYYTCSLKRASKGIKCNNNNLTVDTTDKIIINNIKNIKIKDIKKELSYLYIKKNHTNEIQIIENAIKDEEKAIKNLTMQLSTISKSLASKPIINLLEKKTSRLEKLKNQYKQLKDNLTKTQLNLGNINNLADNLNNFKFMIDKTENIEQKKMLINSVIEDVIVTDEKIEINIKNSK
ncbi:recombinase family protein [Clostridium botulinum]|uniref:Resolvase n=1 Tax=Clostridium botulinum D str. 1873 TaxID=592027 RepID=A0A9P2G805_CLOBO|nr:recombinase family protein [Clostridium botulinum]EES91619.1 resolvase [Clostridium botulinum D str. 1873]MCD3215856.1 recombinase family protein [Clostridium botulinum C]NFV48257.1 recombinase family protein [Clostridium botulinum]